METMKKSYSKNNEDNTNGNTTTTTTTNNNNSNKNATKGSDLAVSTMGLNPDRGQRSVFHVKVDHNFYSEEEKKHKENLRMYKEMQKRFDEAGSRLADAFANSLKDTVHDGFAQKCKAVLGSVFGSSAGGGGGNSFIMAQIGELEKLLSDLLNKMDAKEQEAKQMSYNQVMLKCFLLFIKIQQDYHKQCTESISSFIRSINQKSSTDLLSLLANLNLTSGELSHAHTELTALQTAGINSNNNNNVNTNGNNETKTDLASAEAELAKSVSNNDNLLPGATCLNNQVQNRLPAMHSTSPSPSPSSSSSSSSSVFSSSIDPSFSLFTKLNALYVPISQTAGQSTIDTDNVPSTTDADAAAPSSSSSSSSSVAAASTVLTNNNPDSQVPSPWTKSGVQPLVGAIGKNEKGLSASMKGAAGKANGQLASEEELDSVINLLSGGMVLSQPPPAPPPQPPPTVHMPNQLQPSPLLHAPSAGRGAMYGNLLMSPDAEDQHKMYRANAHRRSEGSLDLSGLTTLGSGSGAGNGASSNGRGGGRNTWPHPNHHHRSSLPAGPLGSHSLLNYDSQAPPDDYSRMLDSTGSLDQRGSLGDVYLPSACQPHDLQSGLYSLSTCAGSSNFMSNSHWTFPDTKLNRTWPVSSLSTGGGGSDTMNSSWSGVQDSSDLSDDSSSGEQFFAVGLDLVHAMDSKDSSSDEELDHQQLEGRMRAQMVSQSLENLYDRKSTYTWPPKHPWARRSDLLLNSPELECTVSTPAAAGSTAVTPSLPSSGPWTADPLQPPRNMWAPGMPSQSQSSQSLSHQSYGNLQ